MWCNIKKMDGGDIPLHYSLRDEQSEKHNLFLGLGGLGIKSLEKIKREICCSIKRNDFAECDNASFLAIDTDSHELRYLQEYYDFADSECMLLSSRKIQLLKKMPEWFSCDDYLCNLNDMGAGMTRQVGRLCLFANIGEVYNKLKKELLKANSFCKGIDIHIITGLAGGTGSGIFLDVCYLIREIIRENGIRNCTITGYCFLPDLLPAPQNKSEYWSYMLKNSYAALKEIKYFMNQYPISHHFCEKYGESINIDSIEPPLNYVRFVSSYLPDNAMMTCESAMNNLVEKIVHEFVRKKGFRHAGFRGWTAPNSSFEIGYISRCNTNKIDENTFQVSHLFCDMISIMSKNVPSNEDFERIRLELDRSFQLMDDELSHGVEVPILDIAGICPDDSIHKWIEKSEEIINENSLHVQKVITERLNYKFSEMIRDPERGVFFISHLVSRADIDKLIECRIREIRDKIRFTQLESEHIISEMDEIKSELLKGNFFSRKRLLATYKSLLVDFFEKKKKQLVLLKEELIMTELLNQVNLLLSLVNRYERFLNQLENECRSNIIYYQNRYYDRDANSSRNYERILTNVMDIVLSASSNTTESELKMDILSIVSEEISSSLGSTDNLYIDYSDGYDFNLYVLSEEMKCCYSRSIGAFPHLNKNWKELIPEF